MSGRLARLTLSAYGLAGTLAWPLAGAYVGWRSARGREDGARKRERYGRAGQPRPTGPLIWLHAASVGEALAVAPLVERILGFSIHVVFTTGTVTSAQVVAERFGDRVTHQYVPLDVRPAIRRFLEHWRPDLAIIAESEIWPVTIVELDKRRVPQVLVNGRMSDRSFASWQRRAHLAEALFEHLAHVVAQSALDGERFAALGARPVTVSGNLKVDTDPPPVDEADLARLRNTLGPRKTWAAISTHEGEEAIAADVHRLLKKRHPGILSIVVPRHPDRCDALEMMFREGGLSVARRSRRDPVLPSTDIYLGDTIGEMGLYLRLTEIAFVGRSLTGEGGQNPLEPAMLETAILSGKNVANFREAYRRLLECGGARLVRDREMLAGAVNYLLSNPAKRQEMIAAGAAAVAEMRGALAATLRALEPFIHPLIVKARLESPGGR